MGVWFHEIDAAEARVGGDWDAVRALLGGKGANLADMTRLGVPVPPGFTRGLHRVVLGRPEP